MEKGFIIGVGLGMIGGIILATKSAKARQMINKGEKEIKNQVDELVKNVKQKKNENTKTEEN